MTTAVLRTSVAVALAGAGLAVAAALASGASAAYAALVGGGLVVAVLAPGSLAVGLVARVMPAASLVVALLTYTLQVVLMAAVFVGLSRSGLLDEALDRTWLGAAIITGTLVWTVVQVAVSATARIPAYDVPAAGPAHDPRAGAR